MLAFAGKLSIRNAVKPRGDINEDFDFFYSKGNGKPLQVLSRVTWSDRSTTKGKHVVLGTKQSSLSGLPGSGGFLENSQETSVKRAERLAQAKVQRWAPAWKERLGLVTWLGLVQCEGIWTWSWGQWGASKVFYGHGKWHVPYTDHSGGCAEEGKTGGRKTSWRNLKVPALILVACIKSASMEPDSRVITKEKSLGVCDAVAIENEEERRVWDGLQVLGHGDSYQHMVTELMPLDEMTLTDGVPMDVENRPRLPYHL